MFHPEEPRKPVEEDGLHPEWHRVGVDGPLVVVEDEDGADHATGHHHHDQGEVDPDQWRVAGGRHHCGHLGRSQQ